MQVCGAGMERYQQALTTGNVSGNVPECLLTLGLLRPLPDDARTLVPIPPDIAAADLARPIDRAIMEQQHTLTALRAAVSQVDGMYQDFHARTAAPIRLLLGEGVISVALGEAVRSCKEELLTAQPGGGRAPELLADALSRDIALNRRGVRQRTLYQHTVRTHGPTLAYIEQVIAAGAEIRTLDEVFERIIICDRSVAFVPGLQDRRTTALAIQHPGIVNFLVKVFDHMWGRAQTITYGPDQLRPRRLAQESQTAVLRLMVRGHTDEAIAARLGISSRTVSSHIKKISDALGSRSRAELGYLVARSGMLDAAESG
ncbi:LuxR C-terminal-related transcriptional regulator [Kitasatospora sp. NPDC058190]|uniref:LuxR C-terminal-related transcriptional regulator n=1 Tax=Kitasatospora sp. NPDC058190 TaxID=3346371 RepID=UPI0036DCCED8